MVTVPKFNREVAPQFTENRYLQDYSSPEAFGVNISKAKAETGKAMGNLADNIGNILVKIKDRVDDTKIIGMANHSYEWEQANLYDKENGYYNKLGQDAYGQSETLIKDYNAYMDEYIRKAKLSPDALRRAQSTLLNLRSKVERGVTEHDFKQGAKWANDEAELGKSNYINNAINQRNNPEEIEKSIASGYQLIEWQGEIQNLDRTSIDLQKKQFLANVHASVISGYLSDGSLKAGEYFEAHKGELNSAQIPKFTEAIRSNEIKYNSRALAENIISTSKDEAEAYKRAMAIKDVDLSDGVVSNLNKHYGLQRHIEATQQTDLLKQFYNTQIQKQQNGEFPSYDDIPDGLDAETKLSLMNYVNKNGQPEDDEQIWQDLYEKSVNDAQGFAALDLNQYRGFLSDGQYQAFVKKQEEIKTGKYYSYIADDDKVIQEALNSLGLGRGKKNDVAFSEIRSMVREFEARKGRAMTDEELMNITNSLGYEGTDGVKLYKRLEEGMGKRTGFIKNVMNDFVYYQNQHNGQMPSDEEKYKIIMKRVNMEQQKQKSEAEAKIDSVKSNRFYSNNFDSISEKPNEQKTLTYFADYQVPELSKQLGFKLTVTDRYRKPNGKYKSHHSEGRAADISMSELTKDQKIKTYEKLLKLPTVQALGTSDPIILARFGSNKKIVDERDFDKKHGTNHVNHVHVTLIEHKTKKGNRKIAQNGTTKF